MVKEFDRYRHLICHLYLDHNLTLEEVRKEMKDTWGFEARVRTYRYHLAEWEACKLNVKRPSICSTPAQDFAACATCRTMHSQLEQARSLAPSPALAPPPDTELYRISVTSLSTDSSINTAQETRQARQLTPSPTPTFWSNTGSDSTSLTSLSTLSDSSSNALQQNQQARQLTPSPTPTVWSDTGSYQTSVTSPLALRPGNSINAVQNSQRVGPSSQVQRPSVPYTGVAAPPRNLFYSPPHAPSSRCRFRSVPGVDPRQCHFCGATELHYLATISNNLDMETLAERIKFASRVIQINQCDVFGNNPGLFLAASCPALPVIVMFYEAGIDLFKRNHAGESFLHLLDPVRLGRDLSRLLEWFHARRSGILTQRTYHGKTVLHCLLERSYFLDQPHGLDTLLDILPIFQSTKNDINARDNQGSTAVELFCVRWLAAKKIDERSSEEVDTFRAICKTFAPDLKFCSDRGTLVPVTLINGMMPSKHSRNGRYSGDHTLGNLELRDRELRDIIAESAHNPLAHDYCGRNGLHCFATIHRLLPDNIEQPLIARKDVLVDMLNRGVDANSFDSRGETPLHTLLSHTRHHDQDNTIALFTKIMVQDYGADMHLRDRNGHTPLHLACISGRLPCVEILLAMGANVNARNYRGWSAITEALYEVERMMEDTMASNWVEDVTKIQQCIDRVRRAGGVDDPVQEDNLYYQDINCTEPSLIEVGYFLPRPLCKERCHLQTDSAW